MRRPVTAVMLVAAALLAGCNDLPSGETGPPPDLRILDGRYRLHHDPDNAAARWVRAHLDEPVARSIERAIAYDYAARWFGAGERDLTARVHDHVAAAAREQWMPLLVANFAGDCTNPVSGEAEAFARGVGDQKAIVVLEPGLLGSRCGADEAVTGYLRSAVKAMRDHAPNALTLIDATSDTTETDELAARLAAAGLADADGFTLNIGGYVAAADLAAGPAKRLLAAAGDLTGRDDYVVLADSARNGAAVATTCNPAEARLGPSTAFSNQPGRLQQVWLTLPGTSDGPCGTAPESREGDFVPALATALAGK